MTLSSVLLRSSDPTGLNFWCVIGFCVGIGLFIYGFRLLQRRRLILDTPFSKIRSASMGMVELSGLAVGPYTMLAPVTARACYYYRTLVWEWKRHGKSDEWVKVAGECMHVPFFLDDNTGRVLVDPRGADLDIHRDFQEEFSDSFFTTKDPVPDNVRSFLARNGIVTKNKIKVEEFCIKPKNALFILGTLAENPGLEITPRPIREDVDLTFNRNFSLNLGGGFLISTVTAGEQLTDPSSAMGLAGHTQPPVSPDPPGHHVIHLSVRMGPTKAADMTQQKKITAALLQAGIVNPAAWAAARLDDPTAQASGSAQAVESPSVPDETDGNGANPGKADLSGFDPHPPVVLMKGTNSRTFLISWRSQQDVARSLGWKCTLMIWGGPTLALISLYLLINIEHLL